MNNYDEDELKKGFPLLDHIDMESEMINHESLCDFMNRLEAKYPYVSYGLFDLIDIIQIMRKKKSIRSS